MSKNLEEEEDVGHSLISMKMEEEDSPWGGGVSGTSGGRSGSGGG